MASAELYALPDLPQNHFDLGVFVINEGASGFKTNRDGERILDPAIQRSIDGIMDSDVVGEIAFFRTSGNSARDEAELKKKVQGDPQKPRKSVAVFPVTGDGGIHMVVNTLYSPELVDLRVPVYPLGGGNRNDTANNLNGSPAEMMAADTLRFGHVVPFYPAKFGITPRGQDTEIRRALLYGGGGAIAELAKFYNQKWFRNLPGHSFLAPRRTYQAATVAYEYFNLPEFRVEDDRGERTLNEFLATNNDVVAQVLHFPVDFEDPKLWYTEVDADRFGSATAWFARAAMNKSKGHYIEPEQTRSMMILDEVEMHLDAETRMIEPETVVDISVDDVAWWGISERFKTIRHLAG
jgi:diacylglycerol kinase family enzyme